MWKLILKLLPANQSSWMRAQSEIRILMLEGGKTDCRLSVCLLLFWSLSYLIT